MSTQEKPIHYEPHPVSPERKAELVAKGVRIIDAAFAPEGWTPEGEDPKGKAKAVPKAKPEGEDPKE